jgi:AbiV family abortive infection protein
MFMSTENFTLSQKDRRIANACLEHAEDLLVSAEILLNAGKEHIAFHLAVLALEEIGKREIITLNGLSRRRNDLDVVSESKLDDHTAKLFWAFFGQMLLLARIDQEKLDEMRGLARIIHGRRLESLYVDTKRIPFKRPKNVLRKGEAESIVSLAKSQVAIEKGYKVKRLTPEDRKCVSWFLRVTSDENLRGFIFSNSRMDKLHEMGNSRDWINWLYEQGKMEQNAFDQLIQTDRERMRNNSAEGRPRWRYRIKLAGLSYKLKQTELNKWNEKVDWIKLEATTAKREQALVLIFTLPDKIPIDNVYPAGRSITERIILALNIGTLGFFWWDAAQHTARFFEKLEDLESQREIVLSETPQLRINWQSGILTNDILGRVGMVLAVLPTPSNEIYEPFQIYFYGLGFLAAVNVYRRYEEYAFRAFYECFWKSVELLGGCRVERTEQEFIKAIPGNFTDFTGIRGLYAKGEALSQSQTVPIHVNLEDVGWMKRMADLYFLIWLNARYQTNVQEGSNTEAVLVEN